MKNLIISSLSIFLILGCGARKAKIQIKSKSLTAEVEERSKIYRSSDSVSLKDLKSEQKTISKSIVNGWKYTAPAYQIRDSVIYRNVPFWLKLNGDSINVSGLPAGASLESRSESSEITSYLQQRLLEQESINKMLASENSKKAKVEYIETEKIKEIERQSIQWILVCLALIIGLFLPSILKAAWSYLTGNLKILSKFKKNNDENT